LTDIRTERRATLESQYGVRTHIRDRFLGSPGFDALLVWLEAYGFSRQEIGRIVERHPQVLQYTIERTRGVLENLEGQALFRREVVAMVACHPALIGCAPERTNALIAIFLEIGIDFVNRPHRFIWSPARLGRRVRLMAEAGHDPKTEHALLFENRETFETRLGCTEEAEEASA
jgi:hypothetical protein